MADLIDRKDALERFPDGRRPWPPHAIRKAIAALAPAEASGVEAEPVAYAHYWPDGGLAKVTVTVHAPHKDLRVVPLYAAPAPVDALVKAEFAEARRTYSGFGHCQEALRYAESMVLAALAAYRGEKP